MQVLTPHSSRWTPPTSQPEEPPRIGPFVWLVLPVTLQILVMFVLIAVDTPLSPGVNKLLERPVGYVLLAGAGLTVVCFVMMIVLSVIEWRHQRDR